MIFFGLAREKLLIAQDMGLVSKYTNVSTPCYFNSDLSDNVPIPFSVRNGVVDIELNNTSIETFVNNGSTPNEDSDYQSKSMGGYRLANRIDIVATYLRNYINATDISGYTGPLDVVVPATMGKVQIAQPGNVAALQFENVFGVNDVAPSSDSFAGGDATLCIWLPRWLNIELYSMDHAYHHKNTGKNFSKRFRFWDQLFGTYKSGTNNSLKE